MPQLVLAGLTVGAGYALVALGIHIMLRATRVINFAQGEFVIVGGSARVSRVVTVLHARSVWLALAGATLAGSRSGSFTSARCLRPAARGGELAATIATIGTVYVLLYGHALIWGSISWTATAAVL
jgi:branched-chain amino acid transport system permease protein